MIYLDYAASTPVDASVAESYTLAQQQFFGNAGSLHQAGLQAAGLLADAKAQIADLLHVKPAELIITSGATEANNLALFGVARAYKARGNHIITTRLEHSSVANPLKALEKEGFEITYLPIDETGRVSVEAVLGALKPTTILVSIIHINNEIGSVQPIAEIGQAIKTKAPQVIFHSDMAQTIGKAAVALEHVDVATFSGHKFYAPKSVGILYKNEAVQLEPLFYGGGQEQGLRPGTENPAIVAATAKAMRLAFERLADQTLQADIIAKRQYLIDDILAPIEDVVVTLPADDFTKVTPYIVHFQIRDSQTEIETYLNAFTQQAIYLSTRSSCSNKAIHEANPILQALGYSLEESRRGIRISLSHLTTMEELQAFGVQLQKILVDLKL